MGKLLLIDGYSILHRTFYGIPDLTNDKGIHTNAIYGFLKIMFKLIEEEQPSHMAVAFDVSAPTFRHEIFKEYKGTRKPMPPELKEQVPIMKDILVAMNIPIREKAGLEADDILGTLAKKADAEGYQVALVSGDRDLLQIATDKIKIRIPKTIKGTTTITDYYAADVLNEYKVTPTQFIELKALMGDSSDNIPGVPKVGPKTAEELMVKYGSLDNIYAHLDEITKKALHDNLANNRELADLSKVLATINVDADFDKDIEKLILGNIYTQDAYKLFQELSFKNLMSVFDGKIDGATVSAENVDEIKATFTKLNGSNALKNLAESLVNDASDYIAVKLYAALEDNEYEEANGQLNLFADTTDKRRVCMAVAVKDAVYYADSINTGIAEISDFLRNLYENEKLVITHNVKDYYRTAQINDAMANGMASKIVDVALGAYLLNPLKSDPQIADIASKFSGCYLEEGSVNLKKQSLNEVADKNADELLNKVCLEARCILLSYSKIMDELKESQMEHLFTDIEMPASYVLYSMEQAGVVVKRDELKAYGQELIKSIDGLEAKIYEQAGEKFNINSPKQLGELLFDKMGLPGGKKTKTGYSTSAEVLEKLAPECPMVKDILEYRTITKLKSTFVDGLGEYIGKDGRIHSNFNQTITATGRISSTDPNLQNIPTRMEIGRQIRKVFVADEGCVLCDADYSQVELRILAAFAGDEALINAYRDNRDIHALTASLVFKVPFEEVTDLMRRNAKAVNFGIVYGISSFGLSQDLSISRAEAKQYIDDYFESYPGIKKYLDDARDNAKKAGYSITYTGRRRPIPELASSNFMQRQFGERVAMNAPIQGSAADVMKIAMINVFDRLRREGLKSKLILQIHDELIIEAPVAEKDMALRILEEEMSGAADFAVKLEVSSSTGNSWYEAK